MSKKYYFFWGGIFSNWYPSKFVVDGLEFNCAEQYMMYMKAMTFKDLNAADEIMKLTDPAKQKKIGRKVKDYDDKVWSEIRYDVVRIGLLEKFKQNEDLKAFLLKHKDDIIVEASPEDRIWGIGYHSSNALHNMTDWGENLLGKMLMDIAKELDESNNSD